MQQLSGMDASFVYFETPATPMHVGVVQHLRPVDRARRHGDVQGHPRQLPGAPPPRAARSGQKMVQVPMDLDHPYWVEDTDFDLEFHVRHIALPKPGDWRQLCIQVARLRSRTLDLSRPLWEIYVIEGLDNVEGVPPGSFALLQKMHHAAIDGVSGMEMTSAIHDLTPDAATTRHDRHVAGRRRSEPADAARSGGAEQRHAADATSAASSSRTVPAWPSARTTSASPVAAPADVGTAHTASTDGVCPSGGRRTPLRPRPRSRA